jgi:hypothetical protein
VDDLLLAEGTVLQEAGSHVECLETLDGLVKADGRGSGSEISTAVLSSGFSDQNSGPRGPFDGPLGRRNGIRVSVTH